MVIPSPLDQILVRDYYVPKLTKRPGIESVTICQID